MSLKIDVLQAKDGNMYIYAKNITFALLYIPMIILIFIATLAAWREIYLVKVEHIFSMGYGLVLVFIGPIALIYTGMFAYRILIISEPYARIAHNIVEFCDPSRSNIKIDLVVAIEISDGYFIEKILLNLNNGKSVVLIPLYLCKNDPKLVVKEFEKFISLVPPSSHLSHRT